MTTTTILSYCFQWEKRYTSTHWTIITSSQRHCHFLVITIIINWPLTPNDSLLIGHLKLHNQQHKRQRRFVYLKSSPFLAPIHNCLTGLWSILLLLAFFHWSSSMFHIQKSRPQQRQSRVGIRVTLCSPQEMILSANFSSTCLSHCSFVHREPSKQNLRTHSLNLLLSPNCFSSLISWSHVMKPTHNKNRLVRGQEQTTVKRQSINYCLSLQV